MKTLFISLLVLITTQLSWALVNVQAGFITENDVYKSGYGATLEIDPIPFVSVGTGLFSREGKEKGSILRADSFVFNPGQTIQVPVYIKLNSPELPLTGLSVHASAGYLFTNSSPSTQTILDALSAASQSNAEGQITAYKETIQNTPFLAVTVNYDVAPFIDLGASMYINSIENEIKYTQGGTAKTSTQKSEANFFMIHLGIDF